CCQRQRAGREIHRRSLALFWAQRCRFVDQSRPPPPGETSVVWQTPFRERFFAPRLRVCNKLAACKGAAVKVCMFHLMPYRDLPSDFGERYKSAYIDPVWFDVADPIKVSQYYNWTLDEFIHAARAGMHGLCTNQHHQNVYGFMANPSLMGSVLAKLTNGQNVA